MKTKNKTPADVETVTITMSRKTAEAVKQACEEYLRLRMGQFEDFTNEVCCWDYAEQMEKECHTTEERKKFHRDHEQDFYKCMRLRFYPVHIEGSVSGRIRMAGDPLCHGVARLPGGRDVERLLLPAQPFGSADAESGTERKGWYGMTITIYPDGHSIQQGTPEELARLVFEMQALQTLQSFRNLVEAIQAEMEKQQKQKEVAATIPEAPKKRPPKRKAKTDGKT